MTWNFHSPLCWNLLTSLQATMPCIRRLLLWLCGKYLLLGVKIQFWDYGLKSVSDWRNRCRVCPALYLSILYFVFNVLYCFMYCTVYSTASFLLSFIEELHRCTRFLSFEIWEMGLWNCVQPSLEGGKWWKKINQSGKQQSGTLIKICFFFFSPEGLSSMNFEVVFQGNIFWS